MNSIHNFRSHSIRLLIASLVAFSLTGCSHKLRVGTISGPETKVMKLVKTTALQDHKLSIKLVEFSDYHLLNTALNDGGIDVNVFQHRPFLEEELRQTEYNLVPIGKTFIYPMGIYSRKLKQLKNIQKHAIVGISNDPANSTRSLRLLEKTGLIKLDIDLGEFATLDSIRYNPKDLQFKLLSPAKLEAALRKELDIAVMPTNYAIRAGLYPDEQALFVEKPDPAYANLIVVRGEDKDNKDLEKLVQTCQDEEVVAYANTVFKGYAISANHGGESGIRTRGRL